MPRVGASFAANARPSSGAMRLALIATLAAAALALQAFVVAVNGSEAALLTDDAATTKTSTATTSSNEDTSSAVYANPNLSQVVSSNASGNQQQAVQSISMPNGPLRHNLRTTVLLFIAYAVVYVVGIVGNSFVVAIVCKTPRMRTVTNYFIANLAFADMLVLLCLPGTLMNNIFIPFYLGLFVCKTVSYLQGVAVSASVNTILAVTLDRFLAICFPMNWHMSPRAARWTIFGIWLFSLTLSLPWAVYFDLVTYSTPSSNSSSYSSSSSSNSNSSSSSSQQTSSSNNSPNGGNGGGGGGGEEFYACQELWPDPQIGVIYFVCANLILCYLLPLFIITVCYLGIWYKIWRRNIPGEHRVKGRQIKLLMQKSKLKVVKMMFVVVIIFIISWAPLYAIFARIRLGPALSSWEDNLIEAVMPFAQWLGASNSCINPILYTFFNSKYKHGFREYIRVGLACCFPSARQQDATPSRRRSSDANAAAGNALPANSKLCSASNAAAAAAAAATHHAFRHNARHNHSLVTPHSTTTTSAANLRNSHSMRCSHAASRARAARRTQQFSVGVANADDDEPAAAVSASSTGTAAEAAAGSKHQRCSSTDFFHDNGELASQTALSAAAAAAEARHTRSHSSTASHKPTPPMNLVVSVDDELEAPATTALDSSPQVTAARQKNTLLANANSAARRGQCSPAARISSEPAVLTADAAAQLAERQRAPSDRKPTATFFARVLRRPKRRAPKSAASARRTPPSSPPQTSCAPQNLLFGSFEDLASRGSPNSPTEASDAQRLRRQHKQQQQRRQRQRHSADVNDSAEDDTANPLSGARLERLMGSQLKARLCAFGHSQLGAFRGRSASQNVAGVAAAAAAAAASARGGGGGRRC